MDGKDYGDDAGPYVSDELDQILAEEAVETAERWLLRASPGASVLYHTGFLGVDRAADPTANLLGALFGWASTVGLVLLIQKQVEPPEYVGESKEVIARLGVYEYLAYRTPLPWGRPLPLFDSKGRLHYNGNQDFMGVAG